MGTGFERGDGLAEAVDLVCGVRAFEDDAKVAGGEKPGVRDGAWVVDDLDVVWSALAWKEGRLGERHLLLLLLAQHVG